MPLPIVGFDTSAHNRIKDDGAVAERVIASIGAKRDLRIFGMSVDELASTPDPTERAALFASCKQLLQAGQSRCLYGQNELLQAHIRAHYDNPWIYDWRMVDSVSWEYDDEIRNCTLVSNDELSAEQRQQQKELQKRYKQNVFAPLRSKFDPIYAKHNATRPRTFREFVEQDEDATLRTGLGKMLYDCVTGLNISRYRIREFMRICPPFRAFVFGMLMAEYDMSIADQRAGERFKAQRNDLFMSIYLPYCDEFVTDEKEGEQARCLREIVKFAGLYTEVLSYEEFTKKLAA